MSFYIKNWCRIYNNTISLQGKTVFSDESEKFKDFIKKAYTYFETDYSKFFKMDSLSKLAFLAADLVLKNEDLNEIENDIALIFSNRASSLDTDRKHQKSIENKEAYFPSPAVFVYTLPNICLGEISIKHKLYSENSFFIFAEFDPEYLFQYAEALLQKGKSEKVLCGWVDFENEKADAFLYLVDRQGKIKHNTKEITELYTRL